MTRVRAHAERAVHEIGPQSAAIGERALEIGPPDLAQLE
jgi:hypothetical protein